MSDRVCIYCKNKTCCNECDNHSKFLPVLTLQEMEELKHPVKTDESATASLGTSSYEQAKKAGVEFLVSRVLDAFYDAEKTLANEMQEDARKKLSKIFG